MSVEVVTGEIVNDSDTLTPAATPAATIDSLIETADVLARIIDQRKLYHVIQGKKHVTIEGWQALAQLLGLTCLIIETERIDGGWFATAEVRRTTDGMPVGRASSLCTTEERQWAKRDDNHRLSMAQTRAQSKAIRSVAGVVTSLAGLEPCPAEEMPANPSTSSAGASGRPPALGRGHATHDAPAPAVLTLSDKEQRGITGLATSRAIDDKHLVQLMCQAAGSTPPDTQTEIAATHWVERALPRFPHQNLAKLVTLLKANGSEVAE